MKPRWRELFLLVIAGLIAVLGIGQVTLVERVVKAGGQALPFQWIWLAPAGALFGLLLVAHLLLCWRWPEADQVLLPVAGILAALGLINISRVYEELLWRQVLWIGLAVVVFIAALLLPSLIDWLANYKYTFLLFGIALVAATLVFGTGPSAVQGSDVGTRLWLRFGPIEFQPSELLKLFLVVFLAAYLDEKRELISTASYKVGRFRLPPIPYLLPLGIMWGLSVLLVIQQRDFGVALLLFGIMLSMLYMASGRGWYLLAGAVSFIPAAYFATLIASHVAERIRVWQNPWASPQGEGFQLIQATMGLVFGGVFGQGLGYGYPGYIPAAHTDMALASLGEQLGLVGVVALIALYALLVDRAWHIALQTRRTYRQLLAAGLAFALALQSFLIMAGNLRVLFLAGVTMPFVSYGGSSMILNFLVLAILLRISGDRQRPLPAANPAQSVVVGIAPAIPKP